VIKGDLNIIINSAASIDLQERIDQAIRINVAGPLQLLELAHSSPNFETFIQVSTCFVNSDRHGYVEETIYNKENVNWESDYD